MHDETNTEVSRIIKLSRVFNGNLSQWKYHGDTSEEEVVDLSSAHILP